MSKPARKSESEVGEVGGAQSAPSAQSKENQEPALAQPESLGPQLNSAIFDSEAELLREVVHSLRTIRYGSIVLTVHDGHLVEINKTVRIRRPRTNQLANQKDQQRQFE